MLLMTNSPVTAVVTAVVNINVAVATEAWAVVVDMPPLEGVSLPLTIETSLPLQHMMWVVMALVAVTLKPPFKGHQGGRGLTVGNLRPASQDTHRKCPLSLFGSMLHRIHPRL